MARIHTDNNKRRDSKLAGIAVRRLAAQARLWKMAPDGMDSRYESLLRRCADTERRFTVTTVSDVLAGITDTLGDTVNKRSRSMHSPASSLVSCDLARGAPEDSLKALEGDGEMTIDDDPSADNQITDNNDTRILDLSGQQPTLITLVSPSANDSLIASESRPKRARTDLHSPPSSSRTRREQRSRRLRRTTPNYPKMSWKRAHSVVQRRKRDAMMSSHRPLENNPGWTPLQKAILRSGILSTPQSLACVFPDSPPLNGNNGVRSGTDENNHRDSNVSQDDLDAKGPVIDCNKMKISPHDRSVRRKDSLGSNGNVLIHRGGSSTIPTSCTPEVVSHSTRPSHQHSGPSPRGGLSGGQPFRSPCCSATRRSVSVFSDGSPHHPHDSIGDDDDTSGGSLEDELISSPRQTSTPICSAMELFLNAEPFVPRLNNLDDDDSALSGDESSWRQCSRVYMVPVQETGEQDNPGDHNNIEEVSIMEDAESEAACTMKPIIQQPSSANPPPAAKTKTTVETKDTTDETQPQHPIPTIEHGVVKIRVSENEKTSTVDVRSTRDWMVSSDHQQDSRRQQTKDLQDKGSLDQHEPRPQQQQLPSNIRPRQGRDSQHAILSQPQSLHQHAPAFVVLQPAASQQVTQPPLQRVQQQHQHPQQQRPLPLMSCGVGAGSGFGGNGNNGRFDGDMRMQQQRQLQHQFPQNGAFPPLHTANQQWHQHPQQQQQQQPQRQFGEIMPLMSQPVGGGVRGQQQQNQFQNNPTWGPAVQQQQQQTMYRGPQPLMQLQQPIRPQLPFQQGQRPNFNIVQQQQPLQHQQQQQSQQHQQFYGQQHHMNNANANGRTFNNVGNQHQQHNHAGFNNNNYVQSHNQQQQQQKQQMQSCQLQQQQQQQQMSNYHGGGHPMMQQNGIGNMLPHGGVHRFPQTVQGQWQAVHY